MKKRFEVQAMFDPDANVWVAHSDDIPGLNTEAETFDALVARVLAVAPELVALNNVDVPPEGGMVHFTGEACKELAAA